MPNISNLGRAGPKPLRVVVTDDHPLMVEAIASIIRSTNHLLVGTCSSGRELLNLLAREQVDALTLDIGMPGLNGLELSRVIGADRPDIRMIFVSQQMDATYVREAFAAGASAFVAKQSSTKDLVDALTAISLGQRYVTSGLLDTQDGLDAALKLSKGNRKHLLTQRQREVLQLIAEGKSAKEIADALHISVKTVEFHKQALMGELNLRTTAELTRYALAHGIVFA